MARTLTGPGLQRREDKDNAQASDIDPRHVAVFALAVAGVAQAFKPVIVKSGNLELTFNGGITPSKLPKTKMAPITLNVSGGIKTI